MTVTYEYVVETLDFYPGCGDDLNGLTDRGYAYYDSGGNLPSGSRRPKDCRTGRRSRRNLERVVDAPVSTCDKGSSTRRQEMQIERQMEILEARHFRADDRAYDKFERIYAAAERSGLIGELCREGRKVHYINLTSRKGQFTGKTKEGSWCELAEYLDRNGYLN